MYQPDSSCATAGGSCCALTAAGSASKLAINVPRKSGFMSHLQQKMGSDKTALTGSVPSRFPPPNVPKARSKLITRAVVEMPACRQRPGEGKRWGSALAEHSQETVLM